MNPEEREEFKKQLLSSLEETKRLAAETREMADAMEARRLQVAGVVTEREPSLTGDMEVRLPGRQAPSLEEMRAYIDKVKKDIEEQRKYNTLPWWKRLFTNPPPRLAG